MQTSSWRPFTLLVALAPLPLGSFRPWAWSLIGVAVSILVSIWVWQAVRSEDQLRTRHDLWPGIILFIVVVLWCLIQSWLPVPMDRAHPIWSMAASALQRPVVPYISATPTEAGPALIRLLIGAGAFWLALQCGTSRQRAYATIAVLTWASTAYAAYGLANYAAGNHYLLWYERWSYHSDVTSTFVNRNTYATFAGLGLLAAVASLTEAYRRNLRHADRSLTPRVRAVESFIGWPLVYMVALLVICMAALQTHSRMGFVAAVAGLTLFIVLLYISRVLRSRVFLPAALVTGMLFLTTVSGGMTLERIKETGSINRIPLFDVASHAIASAPLTGHGYGGFADIFSVYRDLTVPGGAIYTQAHNSYIELALEVGIPAGAALCAALAWFTGLCLVAVFRQQRGALLPALAVSATVLVATHAMLDFSIQIPAVSLLYATLLGLGVAQVKHQSSNGEKWAESQLAGPSPGRNARTVGL